MIEGRERSVSAPLPPAHLQYGGGGGGGAGAGAEPPLPSSAASGGGTYVLELRVTVGGLPSPRVHEVLAAIEQEAMAAAARAMKRLLLSQLHETRTLDARLAAGGVYEVPKVLTRHIALHERLRPDKEKALTAACAALQPLAIQEEPLLLSIGARRPRPRGRSAASSCCSSRSSSESRRHAAADDDDDENGDDG